MSRTPALLVLVASSLALACTVGEGGGGSFGDGGNHNSGGDTDTETGGETDGDTEGETEATPDAPDDGKEFVEEAKKEFPTYLDLHEKVITRTCTPFPNVCHNNKEYPDLRTPQAMLGMLGSPCNLDVEDPLNTYNGCEPVGDVVRFTNGGNNGWQTRVAYVTFATDPMGVVNSAVLYLADPVPAAMLDPMMPESIEVVRTTEGGSMLTVGAVNGAITYAGGQTAIQVTGYSSLGAEVHALIEEDLRIGDPNRDGVFGADGERLLELKAGDPWGSYLLQRLQGNVPGSPMPLANQPLSAAEVVAIACWIEGTAAPGGDSPYAEIDYDGCDYAAEFGEPDPDSGATFSGHVVPIFEARCATAGCHGELAPAAGLDLTRERARDNLIEVPSTQNPDIPLVTPGNPTNSYLMTKLTGDGFAGQRMPLGAAPLSQDELDVVRLWISYGAPDD
ncbi:hypothetical protein OEB96_29970 [Paraliomyxa miuraensis]|nr:hypothetical protein [Paraliomyxa miuraensis]